MAANVDWSRAPEGATHTNRNNNCWFKFDEQGNSHFATREGFWAKNGYSFSDYDVPGELIERPPQWDGEGLPPVGCPIEYLSNQGWKKAECIAHKDGYAILWVTVGNFFPMSESDRENFRPIRTAEQIASDGRAAEVAEMINLAVEGHCAVTIAQARILCTQLHKAGYRKQESSK